MRKRKGLLILVVLIAMVLTGCNADQASPKNEYGDEYQEENSNPEAPAPDVVAPDLEGGEVVQTSALPALENRKIIYTANLTMNAPDPQTVYNDMLDELDTYSAYVETANITATRYVVKVRVLSSNFTDFVEAVKASGEIVTFTKTSEDVTNSYSTFEARQAALEARHTRILELIETAENLEILLQLEEERFNIETELNQVGQALGDMDSLVDYSTVNVVIVKTTEAVVILPQTDAPSALVSETTKHTTLLEVDNRDENPVVIYVDLLQNGEFIRQYDGEAFEDGTAYFELGDLKSDTEYQLRITSISAEHRESNVVRRSFKTESTFFNDVGNVFEGSFNVLVTIMEFVGLAIVAIIPFAIVGAVILVPSRILYVKKGKSYFENKRQLKQKERLDREAKYNQMRYEKQQEFQARIKKQKEAK